MRAGTTRGVAAEEHPRRAVVLVVVDDAVPDALLVVHARVVRVDPGGREDLSGKPLQGLPVGERLEDRRQRGARDDEVLRVGVARFARVGMEDHGLGVRDERPQPLHGRPVVRGASCGLRGRREREVDPHGLVERETPVGGRVPDRMDRDRRDGMAADQAVSKERAHQGGVGAPRRVRHRVGLDPAREIGPGQGNLRLHGADGVGAADPRLREHRRVRAHGDRSLGQGHRDDPERQLREAHLERRDRVRHADDVVACRPAPRRHPGERTPRWSRSPAPARSRSTRPGPDDEGHGSKPGWTHSIPPSRRARAFQLYIYLTF